MKDMISESGALVAYWSDKWDSNESAWWWTGWDKAYSIEKISDKRGRRDVRKGLRECIVRRLNREDFVNFSYNIYSDSYDNYKYHDLRNFSKDQYQEYIFNKSEYAGYELWGAFVEDKMASYASVVVIRRGCSVGMRQVRP